jgi:hypothetical protein
VKLLDGMAYDAAKSRVSLGGEGLVSGGSAPDTSECSSEV